MSRRRTLTEALVGALFTVAALSVATGLLVATMTPWPRELALWLSGAVAGLVAGPPVRGWLALVAARLAGKPAMTRRRTGRTTVRRGR
ncbi:hypothetical protein [Nonomuraea typhae]|uniref:hypothetical protein n=1 Tax=Nonomuraea typhae TaxID=2603600 RepID=UPI0012F8D5C0|nr:hypothetical protein [Nonomuraea typhae]